MLEKNFENVLHRYPELIEEGLKFSGRQVSVGGKFVDLLFIDRFGQKLIIELKRGIIKREHVAQLLDYEGHFLTPDNPNIRVMLIGNRVPMNLRNSLDHHGFEWKEIPVTELITFLKNQNDAELLEQFNFEQSTPIESKKEKIKSIEAKSNNKEKWDGYIRQNGISELGNSKQAQALSLFINGATEEDYKKALPGYSKSFNVMLGFFVDNGFTPSVVNGKTFLIKSTSPVTEKIKVTTETGGYVRRDHNKGYKWDHNQPYNQDGMINSLIEDGKSLDSVIEEFKQNYPEYEGNHRRRVVGHINHLVREHDDFPYNIVDGHFKRKTT